MLSFNQEKALVMVFSVIVKSSRRFVCSSIVQMSAGDHRPLSITDHIRHPDKWRIEWRPFWASQQSARGALAAGALGLQNNSIFQLQIRKWRSMYVILTGTIYLFKTGCKHTNYMMNFYYNNIPFPVGKNEVVIHWLSGIRQRRAGQELE